MTTATILAGARLGGRGARRGSARPSLGASWVAIGGGRILDVGGGAPPAGTPVIDVRGLILAPGFVDMHCHGGGGATFADGPDAARTAAHTHLTNGTTTLMASLVSAAPRHLASQVTGLVPLVAAGTLVGIHLEGPWISHRQCGAHDPEVLRRPDPIEVRSLLEAGQGAVAMVTLAPELDGGLAAVAQITGAGAVVAVGHTAADNATTYRAIDAGATVATHLFNAMPQWHHRAPGPVGALVRDPRVTVELIADLHHLHPDVLAGARAAAGTGRVALVSDAMAAAGHGDGHFRLGDLEVTVADGVARLTHSDALAGSTLMLHRALRHAVLDAGWPLDDAIDSATDTPARALGLDDRGRIAPGLRADLILLDDDLRIHGVMRAGSWIVDPRSRA